MSRRPLIAGNWKLHKSVEQAAALVTDLIAGLGDEPPADVVIAPVFTALHAVGGMVAAEPRVRLAGQDVYWEEEGAHTGEVSAPLLKDVGCDYVIVGHSERRARFHDTDETVRRKIGAVLSHGLTPILCVGETLEQREAGETETVVLRQIDLALEGLDPASVTRTVIAYEPVWAIGTGRTASPSDAQSVHAVIRARLSDRFGEAAADATRILYGGSVKPANAAALLAEADIDGALVGGASLKAESFLAIVAAAKS